MIRKIMNEVIAYLITSFIWIIILVILDLMLAYVEM